MLSYVLYVVVLVLLQVRIQYVRNVISFPGLIFFSGPNYLCAFLTICLINLKLLNLVSLAISRLLAVGIINMNLLQSGQTQHLLNCLQYHFNYYQNRNI